MVVGIERARAGNVVDRALATCDGGNADLLAVPRYSRELILLFLASSETAPLRRASAERYAELMADLVRDGQAAGDVEPRIDAALLARRLFAHYQLAMIEWARGEIDADAFRAATRFGTCVMLLGVARRRARRQLIAELETLQKSMASPVRPPARRRSKPRPRKGE